MDEKMNIKSKLSIDEYYWYKNYFQELYNRNLLLNISSPLISFDDSLRQIYLNSFTGCVYDDIVYVPNGITCIEIKEYVEEIHNSGYAYIKSYKSIILPDTVQFILELETEFDYFDTAKVEYIGEKCSNMFRYSRHKEECQDFLKSSIIIVRNSLDLSNIKINLLYDKLIIAKTKCYSLRKCKFIKDNMSIAVPDKSKIYVDSNCIKYGDSKSKYIICSQYDTFDRSISIGNFTCVNAHFVKESINDIICNAKIEKGIV